MSEPTQLIAMDLDCLGYDPDKVMQQLGKREDTMFVFVSADDRTLDQVCGWPLRFERTKGGIVAHLMPVANPLGACITEHHARYNLSIAGTKSVDGDDFDVRSLLMLPKKKKESP